MLRLAKYIKPYLLLVLLAITLLFIQANADLALPDYMSRIVNIGIQQNGIENAVPKAVRKSELLKLLVVMNTDNQLEVVSDYRQVDEKSEDYDQVLKEYPTLADEPIFLLRSISQAEMDKLNPIMGKAFLTVSAIEQITSDPAKAAAASKAFGFDLSKLPKGKSLFTLMASLPASQRDQMMEPIHRTFASMTDSMIKQSAVQAIKAEYAALGMNTDLILNGYIFRTGGLMLALAFVSMLCAVSVGFLSARVAAAVARTLRRDVFQKVESFSSAEFDKFSTASLITRSTNDVTQVQMVIILLIRMVCYAPIMGVGGIIRAMGKNSSMWWIIAVAVLVLISMVVTIFSISLPKFKIMQNLVDRLNLVTRENLSGLMVTRAFNMQAFEQNRFDQANRELTGTNLFVNRVMVFMFPGMMLIMNFVSILIIWVGAHQIAESAMQVGDMMAFMQYAMQIVFSFLMLSFMFIFIPRASVSGNRIADVIETQPAILDPVNPRQIPASSKGRVEFRNVSFRYPGADEDVLHDINFIAQPGQTTAFIGSTGSGKSTVVNLLPRFYDVTGGCIMIDGIDIRDVTQHDLRAKIGYVPQKSNLFSGTIQSNLFYADEGASSETIDEAISIAQAEEFITTNPEGMSAEISQGGTNVSGGQKQRLSIARALVKRAPIYIFDDSFSALDFKTDSALRKALKEKTSGSTLLIVTQRVSTIKNAEQIIVLDEGQVVGKGTHAELMVTCETYREIALSQLSLEELA